MDAVFNKTQELGAALLETEAYAQMQQAEENFAKDEAAQALLNEYGSLQAQIGAALEAEEADPAKINQLNDRVLEIQQELYENSAFIAVNEARENFARIINQVNQILKFMITGEVDSPEEGGCTEDMCASCGGHCHGH
ncbi:MAG: YlbF family regulator [Clostridiales bacterium]|nr:YlbF family regulator [Clostridiales bacterium]MBQ2817546.1 YlbF family regulator [Clostridia bacterium]MBQ4637840.1 YlbF family regulator [Clostridia bacterium]